MEGKRRRKKKKHSKVLRAAGLCINALQVVASAVLLILMMQLNVLPVRYTGAVIGLNDFSGNSDDIDAVSKEDQAGGLHIERYFLSGFYSWRYLSCKNAYGTQ